MRCLLHTLITHTTHPSNGFFQWRWLINYFHSDGKIRGTAYTYTEVAWKIILHTKGAPVRLGILLKKHQAMGYLVHSNATWYACRLPCCPLKIRCMRGGLHFHGKTMAPHITRHLIKQKIASFFMPGFSISFPLTRLIFFEANYSRLTIRFIVIRFENITQVLH